MPAYDYRCTVCGAELELVHRMSEVLTTSPHTSVEDDSPCDGPLERLIGEVGYASKGLESSKGPSDAKLERLGFTKYVRGSKGYDKAFGKDIAPKRINRE
jgi:putative FmdB family regulatory protein